MAEEPPAIDQARPVGLRAEVVAPLGPLTCGTPTPLPGCQRRSRAGQKGDAITEDHDSQRRQNHLAALGSLSFR
jgi:hypothetical protein